MTEHWPAHLAQHGVVSKMQRDKALVLAQAKQWRETPPDAPVIVAGVMSSVPAVTELLRVVAGLPNGALVLPGLDQTLDEESWQTIVPAHPEHPQFGLKKLLDALEVRREEVLALPGPAPTAAERQRAGLVSEAMRPAKTTERWHRFTAKADKREMAQAVAGVAVLEAPSAEDEAEAIALILREVAESAGPDGGAGDARPPAGAARRRQARSVGPEGRRLGRPAVRQDRRRRAARSHGRSRGQALRAGGAGLAVEASALPARHAGRRAAREPCAPSSSPPSARPTSARGWTAWRRRWSGRRATCARASAGIAWSAT